jgi:hypothetical protein
LILPAAALIADVLHVMGHRLPARTISTIGGGVVLLVVALLVRLLVPNTIAKSQDASALKETGFADWKDAWLCELIAHKADFRLGDVVKTVRPLLLDETMLDDPVADMSAVVTAIERGAFKSVDDTVHSARHRFEHWRKTIQVVLLVLLSIGWLLSATAVVISLFSIYRDWIHPQAR